MASSSDPRPACTSGQSRTRPFSTTGSEVSSSAASGRSPGRQPSSTRTLFSMSSIVRSGRLAHAPSMLHVDQLLHVVERGHDEEGALQEAGSIELLELLAVQAGELLFVDRE